MGFKDALRKITGGFDDAEEEEDYADDVPQARDRVEHDDASYSLNQKNSKVISIPATTHLQVIVFKPEKYSDAAEIATQFKNKKTVVLNLDNTDKVVANRLLDFLGGVAFAADGCLKRIANTTCIIVPYNVEISGDLIDELGSTSSDLF